MKTFGLFMLVLCALLGYVAAAAVGNPAVASPAGEALEAQESRWGHGVHGGHHHGGYHRGGGYYHGGGHHHGGWRNRGGWHHG